jgi:hypothetical protein
MTFQPVIDSLTKILTDILDFIPLTEQMFTNRLKNNEARRMAVAEVLSHLEHLRLAGQVEQRHTKEGIMLFTTI